jgi:predicted NAD-dependent protein-ADP-ribosyltransferase YbiA (DUF1768 family)
MTFIQSDLNDDVKFHESAEPENKYSSIHMVTFQDNIVLPILYGDERKINNVTYYYVYVLLKKQKKIQIGVYEFLTRKLINYLSKSGKGLNIQQKFFPKPLLFSFVTKKYLLNLKKKTSKHGNKLADDENNTLQENNTLKDNTLQDNTLKKEESKNKKIVLKNEIKDELDNVDSDLFTTITGVLLPAQLEEETVSIAASIKNNYSFKKGQFWLQRFMKNNHYLLVENEGGGDCLYACVRDAYGSLGYQTTVMKLRRKISGEISQGKLEELSSKYEFYAHENNVLANQIKELESKYETTQQLFEQTQDYENKKKLLTLSKSIFAERDKVINKKKICVEILTHYDFMKNVDSLEKLKKKMQSCVFWANPWVLSIFERILNIKFIVFDHLSFQNHDFGSVFAENEIDPILKNRKLFEPSFYILLERDSEKNYKLISYKKKQLFVYSELPYDLRDLIKQKCLHHLESCLFCGIKQFQHFAKLDHKLLKTKRQLFLKRQKEAFSDSSVRNLFDEKIFFILKECSTKKNVLPGKAPNEKIKEEDIMQFYDLIKSPDWRYQLHDSFNQAPFQMDGHFWNSVTHYLCAQPFKENFKDYYLFFCAESTTPLSKDPKLALAASSKNGIYKGKVIRPPNIVYKKYYTKQLHSDAIFNKFNQHEDLKSLLLATGKAKLMNLKSNGSYSLANVLMMVRNLLNEKIKNI